MTETAAKKTAPGLTEDQYLEASDKARVLRERIEAGEEPGIPLKPALASLREHYRRQSCMTGK